MTISQLKEEIQSIVEARGVKTIQKDYSQVLSDIEKALDFYKKNKNTDKKDAFVKVLKKLGEKKKQLAKELDDKVSGMYRNAEYQGESVNEDTKKRFDVDFYKGDGDRQTSHEEIIRGDKFSDVVSQATKVAKSKGMNYVEFYYKDAFIGSIDKRSGYKFKKGRNSEKSPLSVNEGRAFINAARKAKQEGKTEFEFNGKKYPVTLKEGTLNEMNPQLNKGVKSLLDKELKDLRKGGSNHLFAVMNVLMGALTDANFHSESKKVPAIFGSKAKYEGDPMAQKDMESLYQSIGERIATMAKWDGEDIANAVGFYVSMTIGRPLGQKIENLV